MQEEPDFGSTNEEQDLTEEEGTLYNLATEAIRDHIRVYLSLIDQTKGFTLIDPGHVRNIGARLIVLGGIDSPLAPATATPEQVVEEWRRRRAVPFDIEAAVTKGVYIQLRNRVEKYLDELERATQGLRQFSVAYIQANPHLLPLLQRLAGISSKAELKKRVGSVSDNGVSRVAAQRLVEILNQRDPGANVTREQVLQSIEPTLEGIVRDLVGKILLESVVADALSKAGVPYKRESEYSYLMGVVYSFRADFVIPDEENPKAFVEVRKSSTRHASLYAKDKMFSAINWKGKNKDLLAVLVVDGPWTAETLKVMANVFDYVVPLHAVSEVAEVIVAYLRGDRSKLRWLIEFAVEPAENPSPPKFQAN